MGMHEPEPALCRQLTIGNYLLPPIKGGSIVERAPVHGSNFVRSYTKSQPHRKSSLPYPDFWQFELS